MLQTAGLSLHERQPIAAHAKPVVWIHLHKAAGTLVCNLAMLNNESVVQPSKVCNLNDDQEVGDGVTGMGSSARRFSCSDRLRHYREGGFTWGQIERDVSPSEYQGCGFVTGVMLREPTALARSVLQYNRFNGAKLVHWLNTSDDVVCHGACEHP